MKTNLKAFLLGVFLLLAAVTLHAQEDSKPDFTREYRFLLGSPDELELIATAGGFVEQSFPRHIPVGYRAVHAQNARTVRRNSLGGLLDI